MRNLIGLPVALLSLMFLVTGCGDRSAFTAVEQGTKAAPTLNATVAFDADAQTFTVSPTGVDDTDNLQAALDGCVTEGPGCTVQLTAGTFRTAMLEVTGFDGFFRGAGQGATIVTSRPNLACMEQVTKNSWPALLKFREGNPRISHLTFKITESKPCDQWQIPFQGFDRHDLGAVLMIAGKPIDGSFDCANPSRDVANSSVDRITFIGSMGTLFRTRNVDNHLVIGGDITLVNPNCVSRFKPLGGTHTVTTSSFRNAFSGVDWWITDGRLTIGGSPLAGNTFDDLNLSLVNTDDSNADIEITHNDMRNVIYFGVVLEQGVQFERAGHPFPVPSRYTISHNTIHAIAWADGVALIDRGPQAGGGKLLDAVVSHNDITLDNTTGGGIYGEGAQDVLVSNNKIAGTGYAGIYMGLWGDPVSGWTLLGNNVQHVTAEWAPIFLGWGSTNITVVGGPPRTNVLDFGTDNIVTGANNMQGNPPGPELQEAMERKRELLKSMR